MTPEIICVGFVAVRIQSKTRSRFLEASYGCQIDHSAAAASNAEFLERAKAGQYSCNPLGKNPGDVWTIPNVKHNHVEKTIHPCQFPIELVERLVLALTNPNDLVVDPYLGVASAACAALLHGRRAAGAEIVAEYVRIARDRIRHAFDGRLRRRPLGRPIYQPSSTDKIAKRPWAGPSSEPTQLPLAVRL